MEEKEKCSHIHPMYDTLTCQLPKGHEGLHKSLFHYETLKWGVPTYEEMYDSKRTK
jgi:hypothetical protein